MNLQKEVKRQILINRILLLLVSALLITSSMRDITNNNQNKLLHSLVNLASEQTDTFVILDKRVNILEGKSNEY